MQAHEILYHGYGRLFDPPLPERLADRLISLAQRGVKNDDLNAINEAISFLSRQHRRNIHSDDGRFSHSGWSKPTTYAEQAVEALRERINEIGFRLV